MKLLIKEGIEADLDLGTIRPGEYVLSYPFAARGASRNSIPEPAYYIDGLTISGKQIEGAIKQGMAEYLDNPEEREMTNLPAVKTECAVVPISPQEQINQASDMARLLKDVVNKAGLAKKLGGKKEHLEFEAWQTIARWHQCTPSTEWTRPIKDGDKIIGWEARVNVLDDTGRIIGSSEGMCMSDEQNWRGKPSYALRSMAQTRTAGKALRSLFAHIAVLAGYSPTPAEEMDGVECKPEHTPPTASTKQQSLPPEPDYMGDNTIPEATFIPSAVTKKEGVTKGKPWTMYTIHNGNERLTTFNVKFAELAREASTNGVQVRVTYRKTENGNNIEGVWLVEPGRQREPGDDDN